MNEDLTRQMLDWLAKEPRTYAETMEAWRTSCPRLSIWEDALIEGLVEVAASGRSVRLTERGRLWAHREIGSEDHLTRP